VSIRQSSVPEGNGLKGGQEAVELGLLQRRPKKLESLKTIESPKTDLSEKSEQLKSPPPIVGDRIGHRGGSTKAGELGDSNGVAASAWQRYLYELTVLLNSRKVYPLASLRLRETGRVVVRFLVALDGTIRSPEVLAGSGSERLNRAAVELVAGIGQFKPLPSEVLEVSPQMKDLKIDVPIEYLLQ
jgi:TonB family protein